MFRWNNKAVAMLYCAGIAMCADVQAIRWEKTFGGSNRDEGRRACRTVDGGYIATGRTASWGAGSYDAFLLKVDSLGNESWLQCYGGASYDAGWNLTTVENGEIVVVGKTQSYGPKYQDNLLFFKTDSLGNTLWQKVYGGTKYDRGWCVQETPDSGFIIVGTTRSYHVDDSADVWLVRTDKNGDTLWTNRFRETNDNMGRWVRITNDGGYIITGCSGWKQNNTSGDLFLTKTDSLGDVVWSKTFGKPGQWDMGFGVAPTPDGGYIVAGKTNYFGGTDMDGWVIKTDSLGDTLWTKVLGENSNDCLLFVCLTGDSCYIFGGYTESYSVSGGRDGWLVKIDTLGDIIWTRVFGGSLDDAILSVEETHDKGFILCGYKDYTASPLKSNIWLIKTDSLGCGIEENGNRLSVIGYRLFQNHPNPFIQSTVISYQIPVKSGVSLKLYDISGRVVKSLVDKELKPGYYTVNWDAKEFPNGIYFARFTAGNYKETKKLIIVR